MAFTKVVGAGIHTLSNITSHNIHSSGILTATGLDISGDATIGGVLTYEDVTSIDSVGLITARNGIDCNADLDVDGHTNLDNVSIAGITTFTGNVRIGDNTSISANVNADNLVLGQTTGNHGITILSGASAVGNLFFGDNANTSAAGIQYFHVDNHMEFRLAGSERLRISSNGRVGISTVTPEARLDVYDTSGLGILSRSASTQSTDTNKALKVRNNSSTDTFNVSYKGQGYFAGKVGIGQNNPNTTLEIKSDANAQTTATIPTLRITNDDGSASANDITGSVEFFTEDSSDPNHISGFMRNISETNAGVNFSLVFGTKSSNIGGDATEKLRIQSDGKIGIGTDNPQTTLHIRQTTDNNTDGFRISRANSNATYSQFINGDNSSFNIGFSNPSTADPDPQITLLQGGNVGVGTDNPKLNLHIHQNNSNASFAHFTNTTTGVNANQGVSFGLDSDENAVIYHYGSNNIRFATGGTEKVRITSGGNVITYNNHTSGTSAHQNTGWYGDDADHYTLEYKDFNEIRAIKTRNVSDYSSIVYKRETMTEYCDIEFTLKGNTPTGTYRHVGFIINGDGSDTAANMDRLVFRSRPASTTHNTIRLDKGGGGYGFNHSGSDIPTFFDGNERHVHIQIRKRTFSITVNRQGHSEYNLSTRMSGDLVASRGYFGFTIYEQSSQGNPEITIRDFKITNYTQNAVPTTSVAFQASIGSGNPSKSSGQVVKPASNEHWDNGYGGNYNTSNYRFTAPVAGIYQFSNTHNVYSSPNGQWAGIKVNGSTLYVGTKINDNVGSGDHNMTCYVTTQLEKGDYVEAIDYTGNSQTYSSGASWNRFEGSLIAAYK